MPIAYPLRFVRLLAFATFLSLFALPAFAQIRTLTDQLGRTLRAEVIAVEGNIVKIKREDGQLFDMPMENLSDDDQIALKKWAKTNPSPAKTEAKPELPVISPSSVTMALSRGKFTTDTTYKSTYSKETYEEWGYSVQITNNTLHPIENLRVEYNIFGRLYSGSTVTRESGQNAIEILGAKKDTSFRTKSFRLYKWKSHDGSFTYNGGVTGVWARLYYGDSLLHEYAHPESIKTREQWNAAEK